MATVTYPLDKDTAGNAYWKVLLSYAAAYPEHPTAEDKKKFKEWFKGLLKSFPCVSCKEHSKQYILRNPPDTASRQRLFDWMCRFENHVREQQGKEPLTCKLESGVGCSSCNVKDVRSSFKDMKDISIRIFKELCEREHVPVPEILFAPCPSAPFTSCTHMEKDILSGKINRNKSVIYLNPDAYSPRTIYHEFVHYAMFHKGKDDIATDEWEVERIAQEAMKKEFPYDKVKVEEKPILVLKDSSPYIPNKPRNYLDEYNARLEQEFPLFAKYKHMQDQERVQQELKEQSGGVLSMFDSIYEPFEESFGLPKRTLNEMHTSNILASTAETLLQSNMTPFGSAVASLATGLGLLGAGILGKKNLSTSDRRFLSEMGAWFLWANISYANPKVSDEVIASARRAGEAAKNMDFATIQNLMLESPAQKAVAMMTQSEAQAQHQARIASRASQRGGVLSRSSARSGGTRPNPGASNIIKRMEQRARGDPNAPANIQAFREFPVRRVSRGVGDFSPNYSEGVAVDEYQSSLGSVAESAPTSNSIPFWGGDDDEGWLDEDLR